MHSRHPNPAINVLDLANEIGFSRTRRHVLLALERYYDGYDGAGYLSFRHISIDTNNTPLHKVKRAVRQLSKDGLAQYCAGLFNGDGGVAGSGYCITPLGHTVAQIILSESENE